MHGLLVALRSLWKRPSFSLIVIGTLGLAIGVNTAIFSVLDAVLLRPLPYGQPERLVSVSTDFRSYRQERVSLSRAEFLELQRESRSFQSLAAYSVGTATFGDIVRPVRVPAAYTTWEFLQTLGVTPVLGRYFDPGEDVPGDPRVVVLGHRLWRQAFGADPAVVGRDVLLDGYRLTVVGVLPEGFSFPRPDVQAWLPLGLERGDTVRDRSSHFLRVVGRLQRDRTLASARAELAELTRNQSTLASPAWHTVDPEEHPLGVSSLRSEIVGEAQAPLWILQAAVLLILLIACANVGNLLLARAESRRRELVIRAALGAGRSTLARLFLTETLTLGIAGGLLGIAVAAGVLHLVLPLLPDGAPRAAEIGLDARVLGFGLGCALATSLGVGLVPLLYTRVSNLHARLGEGGMATTSHSRLRNVLVAGEVAAALLLVIGCGVMLKSFARLSQVDLGFRPEGLLSFEMELPPPSYSTEEKQQEFWDRLQRELSALPGVTAATLSSQLPMATSVSTAVIWFEGAPPYTDKGAPIAEWHIVGDRYFETLGIRLLQGRYLRDDDRLAVVINQSAARKFFPGRDPIGQQIRVNPWKEGSPFETVVGVVADAKQSGLDQPAGDVVYLPLRAATTIKFKTPQRLRGIVRSGAPAALVSTVEAAVRRLDNSLPLSLVRTMDEVVWESAAKPRFITVLMSLFAVLALTLAATGVYGVISYTVEQRTRELGVRLALGAQSRRVRTMVLGQSVGLALWGAGAGLLGVLLASFLLRGTFSSVLYETAVADPVVMLLVSALILAVAALAAWVPAQRATRVDPLIALQAE